MNVSSILRKVGLHKILLMILKHFGYKKTSFEKVLSEIQKREGSISHFNVLEIFGGSGKITTQYYAKKVKSFEIWEYNPEHEDELKKSYPHALIKITDSFKEILNTNNKYNLLIVDNWVRVYGNYCEHFEIFENLLSIIDNQAVLILNVVPLCSSSETFIRYPSLFSDTHLQKRKIFYNTTNPSVIPVEHMLKSYLTKCLKHGYSIDWSFIEKRDQLDGFVYFLCIKVTNIFN